MHEYSLARALLHHVEEIVRGEDAAGACGVSVTIGEFSGVDPYLLQMAFEEISQQSLAANAVLSVEKVALEARCETCCKEFLVERFRFVCPGCGSGSVKVIRGEELTLERVTLEEK